MAVLMSKVALSSQNAMQAMPAIPYRLRVTLKRAIVFNNVFYSTQYCKQNIVSAFNQYFKITNGDFTILFLVQSPWNLICVLHLQYITIQSGHISRAKEPHLAGGRSAHQGKSAAICL